MKKYTLTEYCALNNRPELLEEWDYEKNGELTPDNAYPNSKNKVFWICKEGHQWAVAISYRVVDKTGCPFCAGKRVKSGNNDLETLYPDLAKEWHPTRNGMLKPSDVRPGTHGKVWWQCEKGHEWQARVQSRTYGNGCPYCTGRLAVPGETDLETLYPDLAKEWHPTKNGLLKPGDVHPGTHGKVWWQCEKGHEWQAEVQSRTRGNGCPYCAGLLVVPGETDLKTLYPEIALQWHPTKNGLAKSSEANPGSSKRFWWKCEKGHEWFATIASRVDGTGCPYCTGRKVIPGENDFASSHPELAKEWHPTKNGNLKPDIGSPLIFRNNFPIIPKISGDFIYPFLAS